MRIAMISPLPTYPNRGSGIVGMFVHDLVKALRASGHEVVVFGAADPVLADSVHAIDGGWLEVGSYLELAHAAQACRAVRHASPPFDVVHAHVPSALPFARYVDAPTVHTLHHPFVAGFESFYAEFGGISHALSLASQRAAIPNGDTATLVRYGLDTSRYAPSDGSGGFVAFVGGLSARDAPHLAIDAARAVGLPLLITGARASIGDAYYQTEIEPRLSIPGAASVAHADRETQFFRAARAVLVPEDAAGLLGVAVIEALLCGTPVVASVHAHAAEMVTSGVNGFVYDSGDSLSRGLSQALTLDRDRVRADAFERFAVDRCARDYATLYLDAIERRRAEGGRASNVISTAPEPGRVAG